jgi:hypothetical protein
MGIEQDWCKPIYRIDSVERVFEVLEKGYLTFVHPTLWDDPLENLVFNAKLTRNGAAFEHPKMRSIYGQCWTTDSDSYALWKIFAGENDGIRVATYIEGIQRATSVDTSCLYYGKVRYLAKRAIDELPKDKSFTDGLASLDLTDKHLSTLLLKRKSYQYEKEVRLLLVPDKSMIDDHNECLARVTVSPMELFSSFRFDPRMPFRTFQRYQDRLVNEFGFRKSQIKRSTLNVENRLAFSL